MYSRETEWWIQFDIIHVQLAVYVYYQEGAHPYPYSRQHFKENHTEEDQKESGDCETLWLKKKKRQPGRNNKVRCSWQHFIEKHTTYFIQSSSSSSHFLTPSLREYIPIKACCISLMLLFSLHLSSSEPTVWCTTCTQHTTGMSTVTRKWSF